MQRAAKTFLGWMHELSTHRLRVVDKNPGSLHLLNLRDALLDVRHEPLLVVVWPAGESGHDAGGVSLLELDSKLEVLGPEDVDGEVGEAQTGPVIVELLLLGFLRLGHHKQVIEEEETTLVGIFLLFLVHVGDFSDSTEADQSSPWGVQFWSLAAGDGLLDLAHLCHMVWTLFELAAFNPIINSSQHLGVNVWPTVDASEVSHKILRLHSPLGLDGLVVEICVEEDHGVTQDENCVGRLETWDKHLIAVNVSFGEHFN